MIAVRPPVKSFATRQCLHCGIFAVQDMICRPGPRCAEVDQLLAEDEVRKCEVGAGVKRGTQRSKEASIPGEACGIVHEARWSRPDPPPILATEGNPGARMAA